MLTNSSPQPLLAQFQARYPTASLISELLTIHQDNYVVRAVIQMGNTPIATGMAAANNIEQAEDRAKVRALAALGIESFAVEGTPPAMPSASSAYSSLTFTSNLGSLNAPDLSNASDTTQPLPDIPLAELSKSAGVGDHVPAQSIAPAVQKPGLAADIPALDQPASFDTSYSGNTMEDGEALIQSLLGDNPLDYSSDYSSLPLDPAPSHPASSEPVETSVEPAAPVAPPVAKKSTRRKAEVTEISEPDTKANEKSNESNDRSEEIARIGVEMKRLGWTTEQGRSYLKRTYGKKSRQELSDDELLDFLSYLESQASPTSSLF